MENRERTIVDVEVDAIVDVINRFSPIRNRVLTSTVGNVLGREPSALPGRPLEPFRHVYVNSVTRGNYFPAEMRSLARDILRELDGQPESPELSVARKELYYAIAMTSLQLGDQVSAVRSFELASQLAGQVGLEAAVSEMTDKFTSLLGDITRQVDANPLLNYLKSKLPGLAFNFESALKPMDGVHQASWVTLGARYAAIAKALPSSISEYDKLHAQELINGFALVFESRLKPPGSRDSLGALVLDRGLTISVVAVGKTFTSLQALHGDLKRQGFDLSLQTVLSLLRAEQDVSNVRALVAYGAYLLRNHSLHSINDSSFYWSSAQSFLEVVGVCLAAVMVVPEL